MYNGGNNSILWKSAETDADNPYADGRWRFLLNDLDTTLIDVEVDPFELLLTEDYSFAVAGDRALVLGGVQTCSRSCGRTPISAPALPRSLSGK